MENTGDIKAVCDFNARKRYKDRKYGESKQLLSEENIALVKELLEKQFSIMAVCKMTGISRHYVNKIIKQENIAI